MKSNEPENPIDFKHIADTCKLLEDLEQYKHFSFYDYQFLIDFHTNKTLDSLPQTLKQIVVFSLETGWDNYYQEYMDYAYKLANEENFNDARQVCLDILSIPYVNGIDHHKAITFYMLGVYENELGYYTQALTSLRSALTFETNEDTKTEVRALIKQVKINIEEDKTEDEISEEQANAEENNNSIFNDNMDLDLNNPEPNLTSSTGQIFLRLSPSASESMLLDGSSNDESSKQEKSTNEQAKKELNLQSLLHAAKQLTNEQTSESTDKIITLEESAVIQFKQDDYFNLGQLCQKLGNFFGDQNNYARSIYYHQKSSMYSAKAGESYLNTLNPNDYTTKHNGLTYGELCQKVSEMYSNTTDKKKADLYKTKAAQIEILTQMKKF